MRLIDADKLKETLVIMANKCGGALDILDVSDAIEKSPTLPSPCGMTKEEIDNICHIVHRVILSVFEQSEEERPFTKEELLLLSVNKAICTEIKKMGGDAE